MTIILYAIPGFIFLILAEWLYGLTRGRNTYRVADTITSISLGSISRLRGLFGFIFYLPRLYIGIPAEILFASGALTSSTSFGSTHYMCTGLVHWNNAFRIRPL